MLRLVTWIYRALARPLFFLLDAERAHELASSLLGLVHRVRPLRRMIARGAPSLTVRALGQTFHSPVGLAAGFDKAATMYRGLAALGFGFVEVGTVTALGQAGNPRPRLFRLPADEALVNRMGFNNPGADLVANALRAAPRDPGTIVGINIGKSKLTPLDQAPEDYARSTRRLAPLADYLVVNVSSPNTPGLRSLQELGPLAAVLAAVKSELAKMTRYVPLLVKIAPDLADEDIDAIADLAVELGLAGIIATNTTLSRDHLRTDRAIVEAAGAGGLSGAPLRARSLAVLRRLRARAGDHLTLIAAGGISNADDAWASLRAGATLVQVYTAFVYRGPNLAREITTGLLAHLEKSGNTRLDEVIGKDQNAA